MELYYGDLYWEKTFDKEISYPSLNENIDCDVLVVGAGMSGSLVAYELLNRGFSTVLIDEKEIAKGSTMANTGMLQYSSDKMMWKFAEEIGEKDAFGFYEMCHEAILDLHDLNSKIPMANSFHMRPSIYYASDKKGIKDLEKEYNMLKKYNLPVEEIGRNELIKNFNMDKEYALITRDDAEINPYKFINLLVEYLNKKGLKVFENTSITNYDRSKNETKVTTQSGSIKAKYIVLATGYVEQYVLIKDKSKINMTYAFATKPIKTYPWKQRAMIWETNNPYLYFRCNDEDRIIGGGLDRETPYISTSSHHIYRKANKILKEIKDMFPTLDTEIEFAWNAQFGESKDGLPYIGQDPDIKNLYYCLGLGGNGTAYSMAGGKIIADLISNKNNKYAHIVKMDR